MAVEIFLDSGAFSHFNKLSKARTKKEEESGLRAGRSLRLSRAPDFSYVLTPEYRAYRDRYAEFLRTDGDSITVFPNLDVIRSAELTYRNQVWFEDRGIRPTPVWHLGSGREWLRLYLSEGYDYLCIGGMVGTAAAGLRPALDALWRDELTDADGFPRVRVHGFGMTNFELMRRYPWYSVDSKSWLDHATQNWAILVPGMKHGQRDFSRPQVVYLGRGKIGKIGENQHLTTMTEGRRRGVFDYLREVGAPLGLSTFKRAEVDYELREGETWAKKPRAWSKSGEVEVAVEPGVINDRLWRLQVNLRFYQRFEQSVPKWPWPLDGPIKRRRGLLAGRTA